MMKTMLRPPKMFLSHFMSSVGRVSGTPGLSMGSVRSFQVERFQRNLFSRQSPFYRQHRQIHVTESSVSPEAKTAAAAAEESKRVKYDNDKDTLRKRVSEREKVLLEEVQQKLQENSFPSHRLSNVEATAALQTKLEQAIDVMQVGLIERDTEVRLLLLAALTGEHILFIGPPGTAKSELGRRLSKLYRGTFFERLLTRFSVPEELFGPLSMRALEEDVYQRKTEGYLPNASVAFIDEIFKANSAILNTLLTILNERLFDNGALRVTVPLVCVVGASNELPESEELDALYDRFLIRRKVRQVSLEGLTALLGDSPQAQRDAFFNKSGNGANGSAAPPPVDLSTEDFSRVRREALTQVKVPESIILLMGDLRTYLQEKCEPPIYVSDRRLVKAVALMQVAAYTSGRDTVSGYDTLLLQHVLWQRPEESERIGDWLAGQLAEDDGLLQFNYVFKGCFDRTMRVSKPTAALKAMHAAVVEDVAELRKAVVSKLAGILQALKGDGSLVAESIWLGKDEAESVATFLQPKLVRSKDEALSLLREVLMLELSLEVGVEAVSMAELMPNRWADFIRGTSNDEAKKIGTRHI